MPSDRNSAKENKMGVMPVPKLLLTMSTPMVISMLIQAMYNVVDSIYVSRIGEDALTAVSLSFPVQNLMIAVCAGTGVGINAYMSRSLGAGQREEANKAARNGLFLAAVSSLVFMIFGIFFSRLFFEAQKPGEVIVKYGHDYLSIVCGLSFGIFIGMTSDRMLQGTGRTLETMFTLGLGAILNILLDPVLIFGMFGLPRMETAGAALATVIGQMASMVLSIHFNLHRNTDIDFSMRGFRPDPRVIGIIYKVGVPSIIMQSIGSVMTFCMNKILLSFSTTAVSVFGVYFKLQSFIFMPIFGMNNGIVPIIAYNYGAQRPKRIREAIRCGIMAAMSMMVIGLILFQVFPRQLLGLFDASEQMLEIGVPALRTLCLPFVVAGACIVLGSTFQALGNSVYSLMVSLVRQIVLLLPAAWILARVGGLSAVWWSFPIAEVGSFLVTIICYGRINRQILQPLERSQA